MGQAREQLFRRFGILAIVFGGHVLLVLLITSHRAPEARKQSSTLTARTVLVLLDAELRREPPKKIPVPIIEEQPRRDDAAESPTGDLPRDQPAETTSTTDDSDAESAAPTGTPQIDWHHEAEITIDAMAPRIVREIERKCAEAKRTGAAPPVGCKKASYEADWEPEPGRVGMSGLIPFVRLGKRCVVGLGFFGCAVGKLPEADGTLFEDMDDPNRPRSSVPDIDTGGGLAELPPPVVVIEQ